MEEKKENRGGKREGAGRKKGVESKKILLNLELELVEALESANNKTLFINAAVKFALKEIKAAVGIRNMHRSKRSMLTVKSLMLLSLLP